MSLNDLCAGPSLGCSLVWMVGEPYQLIFPFVRNVAFPRARSLNGGGWICALSGCLPAYLKSYKPSSSPEKGIRHSRSRVSSPCNSSYKDPPSHLLPARPQDRAWEGVTASCDRVSSSLMAPGESSSGFRLARFREPYTVIDKLGC